MTAERRKTGLGTAGNASTRPPDNLCDQIEEPVWALRANVQFAHPESFVQVIGVIP